MEPSILLDTSRGSFLHHREARSAWIRTPWWQPGTVITSSWTRARGELKVAVSCRDISGSCCTVWHYSLSLSLLISWGIYFLRDSGVIFLSSLCLISLFMLARLRFIILQVGEKVRITVRTELEAVRNWLQCPRKHPWLVAFRVCASCLRTMLLVAIS